MVSSQDFLLTNAALAVGLTVFLWHGRPRLRMPSKLRLRSPAPSVKDHPHAGPSRQRPGYTPPADLEARRKARAEMSQVRSLNIQFVFNGHNFDAHEVLGIPAGCSKKQVEEAYMNSLRGTDEVDRIFIESAYQAIIQKISS